MSVPPEIKKLRAERLFEPLPPAIHVVDLADAEAAVSAALARQRDEIVEWLRSEDRELDAADSSPAYQDGWVDALIDAAGAVARRFPNGGTHDG